MKIQLNPLRKPRIEMLPLIDVVFLLLVFFLYSILSMAVHRGMPVDLPISSTVKVDKKLIISVTIDGRGQIFLDKKAVALKELAEKLRGYTRENPIPGVLLFADKNLPYQQLFAVIDQIKTAGISRISLQAEVEDQ
jgi:biopolymer transport protein ExbD